MVGFKPGMKGEGVMNDESGESTQQDDVTDLGRPESESDRLR